MNTLPTANNWNKITDASLALAVELAISPADIICRDAAIALLEIYGFTPRDIEEIIAEGVYFSAGMSFYGLNTPRPRIINNLEHHRRD